VTGSPSDGDGLIWIVQPQESALNAAPQFDEIWRGHADGSPRFLLLLRRNREPGRRRSSDSAWSSLIIETLERDP